ncbi:MAG: LysM peptidoglycan-binding domain-containing protein [bacterium]|nr:LysM peptidoglycan-binding domain-containing protein [bacterium]
MKKILWRILCGLLFINVLPQAVVADNIIHTVKKGESLWKISRAYQVPIKELIKENNLDSSAPLQIGQKITIPNGENTVLPVSTAPVQSQGFYHTVAKGDTLWELSHRYKVPVDTILQVNNITSPQKLFVGKQVFIPIVQPAITRAQPNEKFLDYVYSLVVDGQTGTLRNWQYILIHHSATDMGNARSFDNYHRYKRRMANGLAYHFVITNGNKGPDGNIEVGPRWKNQINGGHVKSDFYNNVGIGICLVGNFEEYAPTGKQFASLVALVEVLQSVCGIPDENVLGHRHIKEGRTLCPGSLFPFHELQQMIHEKKVYLKR